jgi:polyhydroxybutyrate depolymerase
MSSAPDGGGAQDAASGAIKDGSTAKDGGKTGLPGTSTRSVDKRPYKLVVPSGYVAGTPIPFLLLLHGYGETAADINTYFATEALAEKKTFILALPEGNKNTVGYQYWNADDACCDYYSSKPDDSTYLHDIIADVKSTFDVDPKRVFVAGHSNGGFMSHRMACDHADEIAAIVSLAGEVWKDPSKCTPSAPVSVLQVQGDADQLVYYVGGTTTAAAYPSAPDTVATWATKNGCGGALTDSGTTLDLDALLPGTETKVERHACTHGAAELWTIHDGAHFPTFQATWGETFYAFLSAHPKP